MRRELLNYPQTAEILGVTLGRLRMLVHQHKVPFVRIAERTVRFPRDLIEQFLRDRTYLPAGAPLRLPNDAGLHDAETGGEGGES